MLALHDPTGPARRHRGSSDGAGTFMLLSPDPSQLGSWTLLAPPTDSVITVNGSRARSSCPQLRRRRRNPCTSRPSSLRGRNHSRRVRARLPVRDVRSRPGDRCRRIRAWTAGQSKTGAETAKLAAEKARDETEQVYVLLGNVSGTKTLTLAETNKPTGWDATLTANTDFVLPSLGKPNSHLLAVSGRGRRRGHLPRLGWQKRRTD